MSHNGERKRRRARRKEAGISPEEASRSTEAKHAREKLQRNYGHVWGDNTAEDNQVVGSRLRFPLNATGEINGDPAALTVLELATLVARQGLLSQSEAVQQKAVTNVIRMAAIVQRDQLADRPVIAAEDAPQVVFTLPDNGRSLTPVNVVEAE